MIEVLFERLDPRATMPRKAYPNDAAFDLFVLEDTPIKRHPSHRPPLTWLRTGIAMALPDGWYARIVGRSSTATRGLHVIEGVMDAGYRGEQLIRVCPLWADDPRGRDPFHINAGESLAQLIVQPVPDVTLVEVDVLPESERGINGFGSSSHV